MNRIMFLLAFLVGASAVIGMSYIFLGADILALSVTLVIAFVYGIGTIELVQFHKATFSLKQAIQNIPEFSKDDEQQANTSLAQWMDGLHSSLKYSVHSRIEGESKGLPSPVLAPYLVGLLVMLGLLGTFAGMVDTLQGSVIALQGSTELSAIREGLAAPIKGLGAAFGTSVAGVAASAMLGLMSTLVRRERVIVTRELDMKINTVFRRFSLNFNRQETYKSLQQQAKALPDLTLQIAQIAQNLEQVGQRLGQDLNTKQDKFHQSVEHAYKALADSVKNSLNQVVQDSGELVAKQMSPVVNQVISDMAKVVQQQSLDAQSAFLSQSEGLIANITKDMQKTSDAVNVSWQKGIQEHQSVQSHLSQSINESMLAFSDQFRNMSDDFITRIDQQAMKRDAEKMTSEELRFSKWLDSLSSSQVEAQEALKSFAMEQKSLLQSASSEFLKDSKLLSDELSGSFQAQKEAQQKSADLLLDTLGSIHSATKNSVENIDKHVSELHAVSEQSIQIREKAEADWLALHSETMTNMSSEIKQQLSELREQESIQAEQALNHLAQLEASVASQLADLGQALELPMSRLIETASEAPKAAAEVISKLKQEMTQNMARDNDLLEERRRIMSDLDGLSDSIAQSTLNQGKAMETLLQSSGGMLAEISERFDSKIDREVSKLSDIALQFSESSVDIAGMGEAFVGAVVRFSESNDKLVEHLNKIEQALSESTTRSDEQLAYYVAQAREIIDHSMMSQKGLIEEINQMALKRAEEVGA